MAKDSSEKDSPHSAEDLDPSALETDTLNTLQTQEQRELLNEIDKLRGHGVNEFVSLPQLGEMTLAHTHCLRFN